MSYTWRKKIRGGLLVYEIMLYLENDFLNKADLTLSELSNKLSELKEKLSILGLEALGNKIDGHSLQYSSNGVV